MRLLSNPRRTSLAPLAALATLATTFFYDPFNLFSYPTSSLTSSNLSSSLDSDLSSPPSSRPVRSWRDDLELVPDHDVESSRTLGFSIILAITLPGTEETRGLHIDILSEALEIDITRFPGTLSSDPIITWIAERVLVDKLYKNTPNVLPPYPYEAPSAAHEGLFWPMYLEKYDPVKQPEKFVLEGKFGGEEEIFERLVEAIGIMGELEKFTPSGLRGMIACWHAHLRALLWIHRTPGIESALILEDDVDIEFDIKRLWGGMSSQLPSDWDMVYLGYVWSQENLQSSQTPIAIRPSSGPLGTMAYAVSKKGAANVLHYLHGGSPYTDGYMLGVGPFGQALDNALRTLISFKRFTSYSVSPPLIIHPGFFSSAIGVGGSAWNGTLIDSTVARVCRHYGVKGVKTGGCFHGWQHWIREKGNPFRSGGGGRIGRTA